MSGEITATNGMLKIEKAYPFKSGGKIKSIFVIGAGGTGSYVVQGLARDIYTMKVKPALILCDGDTVEDKNLKRQLFAPGDVGQNKAVALATRYSAALGLQIGFKDEFIEKVEGFTELLKSAGGDCLVVTCVDNVKTRFMLREAIKAHADGKVFWLDTGNEEKTGQVVLGARVPLWNPRDIARGVYPMPDVFDVYPELLDRLDKTPSEMSCAELAASSPQYGFVNLLSATIALNVAHNLLHNEPVKVHSTIFSIDNKFSHKSLAESYIQSWTKFFDKFKTFNYFEEARLEKAAKAKAEKEAAELEADKKKQTDAMSSKITDKLKAALRK